MARELHSSFHRILETVDWMDEATRIQALSKLENMALMVGYPDELQDDNVLIKHYSGVCTDYVLNHSQVLITTLYLSS